MPIEKFTVSSSYLPSSTTMTERYKALNSFIDDFLAKIPHITVESRGSSSTAAPNLIFKFGNAPKNIETSTVNAGRTYFRVNSVGGFDIFPDALGTKDLFSTDFFLITSITGDKFLCGVDSEYKLNFLFGDVIFWNARDEVHEHLLTCIGSGSEFGCVKDEPVTTTIPARNYNPNGPSGDLLPNETIMQQIYCGCYTSNLYRDYRALSTSNPGMVYRLNDGNQIRNFVSIYRGILVEI